MEDHAYSFYCRDKYWQRCDQESLEVVAVLGEEFNSDGDLKSKEAIYRCRLCGGFYKQMYRATYYHSHLFDTEEGWSITDDYFRIEEPRWKTPGSTLDVPFTIHEARKYGYDGEDHSWKNGRCNFPPQNVELTCRTGDLQFVADASPNAWDHLRNKLYTCRRCGEWYLFTPLPPHPQGFFKPANELFPLDLARAYGYEAVPKTRSESNEGSPDFDALAQKAIQSRSWDDWNALFAAVFALPEWIFIARGSLPNLYPYSSRVAGGMLLANAFTDSERAVRFARENNLTEAGGDVVTLHIPTADVVKYLENPLGGPQTDGVWINSDSDSSGFFIPLKELGPLFGSISEGFAPKNDRRSGVS